jgi:surface protein
VCKLSGSSVLSNVFSNTAITELSFPNLTYRATNLNNYFQNMLQGCSNVTVHFPAEWQTAMSSWSNVTNGFGGTNTTVLFDLPNITTLDLSKITIVPAGSTAGWYKEFGKNNYSPNITSVNLSNLVAINCVSGCSYMFQGCTGITSADLSSLTAITQQYGVRSAFSGCSALTSINLSSLKTVTSASTMTNMFQSCTSLTSVSFPAFKNIINNVFGGSLLQGVTGCTVHFPSNMSGVTGISNVGGTNTTVLFDLPATVILTGANTVEYERNPKYDTATALAWRVKDGGTDEEPIIDWTPFYTSGTTDPQTSDTIYSDSACTVAVTTISSIA